MWKHRVPGKPHTAYSLSPPIQATVGTVTQQQGRHLKVCRHISDGMQISCTRKCAETMQHPQKKRPGQATAKAPLMQAAHTATNTTYYIIVAATLHTMHFSIIQHRSSSAWHGSSACRLLALRQTPAMEHICTPVKHVEPLTPPLQRATCPDTGLARLGRHSGSPARAVLCGRPVALLATLHGAQVSVQPGAGGTMRPPCRPPGHPASRAGSSTARRGRYYAAALSPSWPPCIARRFQYSPSRAVLCGRPVALLATLHRAQVPVQPVADAAEPVVGDADVAHGRHRVL